MAKIKGPLFSLDASGKLADSLVYLKWKGINDVRSYVIPANPRTEKQQAQRTKMTEAVDLWHATAFNDIDFSAWDLFASIMPTPMSGFNAFIKCYIDAKVAAKNFTPLYAGTISNITSSGFTFTIKSNLSADVKLYIGTSKTVMGTAVSGTYNSGTKTWTFTVTGLASGTKYYFEVKSTDPDDQGRTGIYTVTTSAA
jgi:hypothetical protein